MQLEHAILILFPTIWPLAGLKYDSINYCQESPGAKPFSRRRFGGAPGVLMGLFSPSAVGFGDVAQPHPTLQGRAWPQLLLGTTFGVFLGISSLEGGGRDAMRCAAHLNTSLAVSAPKWDVPSLGGPVVLTRCLHVPILSPRFPGAASFAPNGSCTSRRDLVGFSPCSHELLVALWGRFGIWGEMINEAASWRGGSQD